MDDHHAWLREKMRYPRASVACVRLAHFWDRLKSNMATGFCVTSDFSGTGGSHDAIQYGCDEFEEHLGFPVEVVHARACDKAIESQLVLMNRDRPKIECVFDNLEDRVPPEILAQLNMHQTEAMDSRMEDAERRQTFQMMLGSLRSRECFPGDATAHCKTHCGQCPVRPKCLAWSGHWASSHFRAGLAAGGGKRARVLRRRPWFINCGSTECIGFSTMGSRKGYSDGSAKTCAIYIALSAGRMPLVVTVNTLCFRSGPSLVTHRCWRQDSVPSSYGSSC